MFIVRCSKARKFNVSCKRHAYLGSYNFYFIAYKRNEKSEQFVTTININLDFIILHKSLYELLIKRIKN